MIEFFFLFEESGLTMFKVKPQIWSICRHVWDFLVSQQSSLSSLLFSLSLHADRLDTLHKSFFISVAVRLFGICLWGKKRTHFLKIYNIL